MFILCYSTKHLEATMISLPVELRLLVLENLCAKDLVNVCLVSPAWESFFASVTFERFGCEAIRTNVEWETLQRFGEALDTQPNLGRFVRFMYLHNLRLWGQVSRIQDFSAFLKRLFKVTPKLEKISISDNGVNPLAESIVTHSGNFSELKTFSFVSDSVYRPEIDISELKSVFCLSIAAFSAIGVYNEKGLEIPRQSALRSLYFRESCFDREGIARILQACPALQSFIYEQPMTSIQFWNNTSKDREVHHFNMTDVTIALEPCQECLEELSLQFPRVQTPSGIIEDLSQFSSLKRLSVDQRNLSARSTLPKSLEVLVIRFEEPADTVSSKYLALQNQIDDMTLHLLRDVKIQMRKDWLPIRLEDLGCKDTKGRIWTVEGLPR